MNFLVNDLGHFQKNISDESKNVPRYLGQNGFCPKHYKCPKKCMSDHEEFAKSTFVKFSIILEGILWARPLRIGKWVNFGKVLSYRKPYYYVNRIRCGLHNKNIKNVVWLADSNILSAQNMITMDNQDFRHHSCYFVIC